MSTAVINRSFGRLGFPWDEFVDRPTKSLSYDVWEVDGGIVFEFDVPGIKKEDVQLHVENGHLELQTKRELDSKLEGVSSRPNGEQKLRFKLSRNLDTSKVEAKLEDGVLRVEIGRRAELAPKKIVIS